MARRRQEQRPEPCQHWQEWLNSPEEYHAFSYWAWDIGDPHNSEKRLGERLYICSCLLWSSLHDYCLARRFFNSYPNWSAICSYYSMVHALRFFWFLSYGSYPTGHAQMAQGLTSEEGGATPNWQRRDIGRAQIPITVTAFETWIAERLKAPTLAKQLSKIGKIFAEAKNLRNDSNYESLILAHQYYHRVPLEPEPQESPNYVNVQREFVQATESMQQAAASVLRFVIEIARLTYEADWLLSPAMRQDLFQQPPAMQQELFPQPPDAQQELFPQPPDAQQDLFQQPTPYSSIEIYSLMLAYIKDKIDKAEQRSTEGHFISQYIKEFEFLDLALQSVTIDSIRHTMALTEQIQYSCFGMKSDLMWKFHDKVDSLSMAVYALKQQGNESL